MKKFISVLSVLILMALAGCGGGGGSGDDGDLLPNSSATGLWIGSLTDDTGTTFEVSAVISPTGRMVIYNSSIGAQYSGQVTLAGNQGAGSFTGYAPDGYVFGNGSPTASGTISFNVVEKASLSGSYTAPGDTGTFSMIYAPDLEGGTLLSSLAGKWGYNAPSDWVHFTIAQSGAITGVDDVGCLFSGQISAPSADWSIFPTSVNVSQCGIYNGTYSGLSIVELEAGQQVMTLMLSNGTYSVLDRFVLNGW